MKNVTFIQLIGVDLTYIDACIAFIPLWREIMVSLIVVVFPIYTSASLWLNPKKWGVLSQRHMYFKF